VPEIERGLIHSQARRSYGKHSETDQGETDSRSVGDCRAAKQTLAAHYKQRNQRGGEYQQVNPNGVDDERNLIVKERSQFPRLAGTSREPDAEVARYEEDYDTDGENYSFENGCCAQARSAGFARHGW
jgi:hypothetical protein